MHGLYKKKLWRAGYVREVRTQSKQFFAETETCYLSYCVAQLECFQCQKKFHIENLEAKSVLVGRSYFYHFNDHTFSKKFRVLTNRSIVRIATAAGKNSQI